MKIIDNLQKDDVVWQPDFQSAVDENGLWTGSQSFECKPGDVQGLIPARGDACQQDGWELLKFISATVTETAGRGWMKVVCSYRGTQYAGDGSEFEDGAEDAIPTYSTSIVAQSEPIESHPKFKELTIEEWADAQWYKDGRIIRNPGGEGAPFKRNVWVEEDKQWQPTEDYTPTGELPALFEAYDKGFTAFYSPRITHTKRYTSNQPLNDSVYRTIGTTKNQPTNAPSFGPNRNWLSMGANTDQSDNVYEIELEWMLSGDGKWDEDFYD